MRVGIRKWQLARGLVQSSRFKVQGSRFVQCPCLYSIDRSSLPIGIQACPDVRRAQSRTFTEAGSGSWQGVRFKVPGSRLKAYSLLRGARGVYGRALSIVTLIYLQISTLPNCYIITLLHFQINTSINC